MKRAILKISYDCDNKCIFCHAEDYKKIKNVHEKIIFHKINNIKDNYPGINQILFSGGEPTINRNILKYIDFSKKLGFKVGLITNGSQLNNIFYQKNIESGILDYIYLSLHGPNSEIHNKIAGNDKSFQSVDKFLKSTSKYKNLELVINCVVNRFNIDSLEHIVEYISKYNHIKIIKFSLLEPKGSGMSNIEKIYVPVDLVAKKIQSLVIKNKTLNIYWDGLPLCVMDGLLDRISNLKTENIEYMSETFESKIYETDFSKRQYSLKCNNCCKKEICPGIYKGYIDIYGDYYLRPYKC